MPGELHPFTDFHKAGYLYLLFCWGAFLVYCACYQADQLSRTWLRWRGYRRRSNREDEASYAIKTPWDAICDLLRPLERTMTIPYIAMVISIKHLIGMSIFIIVNIIFCWFAPFRLHPSVPHYVWPTIGVLDRRMVYICMVNWSFTIVLGTRNSIVTNLSGLTFENLIPFHRWVARVGLAETILHSVYRWWEGYATTGRLSDAVFLTEEYLSGTVSTIGYIILFGTAFNYIQRNYFRLFYYSHLIGFIVGTGGAMWHEWSCIYFFVPPVLLWILDRMVRIYKSWCYSFNLIHLEQHSGKIVHAKFKYGNLDAFRPGHYLFAAFLTGNGGWRKWLQQRADWYPMTISEIFFAGENANQPKKGDVSQLAASIHIKALGDGTRQLVQAIQSGQNVDLRVDGPYGPRLRYLDYSVVALFAVGIGITPALAIMKDCIDKQDRLRSRVRSVYLTWSVRKVDEIEPFIEYLTHCATLPSSFVDFNATIHITREKDEAKCTCIAEELKCKVIRGARPQISKYMDNIAYRHSCKDVWVHTCGSVPFMINVINESIKYDFDVSHETFEF